MKPSGFDWAVVHDAVLEGIQIDWLHDDSVARIRFGLVSHEPIAVKLEVRYSRIPWGPLNRSLIHSIGGALKTSRHRQ